MWDVRHKYILVGNLNRKILLKIRSTVETDLEKEKSTTMRILLAPVKIHFWDLVNTANNLRTP